MRHFSYYYFDNFNAEEVKFPEDDPRMVLNSSADGVLTELVESPPGICRYEGLCRLFSKKQVDQLIHIGLLRREADVVLLDSPVFVEEDAEELRKCFLDDISRMSEALTAKKEDFISLAQELNNGFPPEVNLYHLLCGAIFDGEFFDCLSDRGLVSTSRIHPSGLDYLIIVYERSPALEGLSNKLLCSYNRFTDGVRALQSFGDAAGDRLDFFRFSRQKQLGKVPADQQEIEKLWDAAGGRRILTEVERFDKTGSCEKNVIHLLEVFGYLQEERFAVPVYRSNHRSVLEKMEQLTESCILTDMEHALNKGAYSNLLCSRHGVSAGEIANELYHVVFGQLNEQLVKAGMAAQPPRIPGQGRYLKSIELM